jgi:hypothetical protein
MRELSAIIILELTTVVSFRQISLEVFFLGLVHGISVLAECVLSSFRRSRTIVFLVMGPSGYIVFGASFTTTVTDKYGF